MAHTPNPRAAGARPALAVVVLMLAGCGKSVVLQEEIPTPLVGSLPLSVGVHYNEELQSFSFLDTTIDGATWSIDLGSSNVRLFDQIFNALFNRTVRLETLDDRPAGAELDAIISPVIEEYAFLAPSESGSQFWAVSIRYRMELYDGNGAELANWEVVAYGKSRSRAMRGDESLSEATSYALRDAAAALAVEIPELPEVMALVDPPPPESDQDPETARSTDADSAEPNQEDDDEVTQADERDS